MNNLKVSPQFTNDDIHNIRVYNSERRKNMTDDEAIVDIQREAGIALRRMEKLKRETELVKRN